MNIQRSLNPPSGAEPVRLTVEAYFEMAPAINVAFERTELLDGWIYEMPADGARTRLWNRTLTEWLIKNKGEAVALVSHQSLPLGEYWAPSPDHYLFPEHVGDENVTAKDVLLVIEVSDTTLAYDLGGKAEAYAAHGVREYWVVDIEGKRVLVHRLGGDGRYGEPTVFGFEEAAPALLIPGLSLRLADLPGIR